MPTRTERPHQATQVELILETWHADRCGRTLCVRTQVAAPLGRELIGWPARDADEDDS
jgi:hypothetical protein